MSQGANWRKSNKRERGQRSWQEKRKRSNKGQAANFHRRLKLLGWLLGFGIGLAVFLIILFARYEPTTLVYIGVAHYDSMLPVNGWTKEDRELIELGNPNCLNMVSLPDSRFSGKIKRDQLWELIEEQLAADVPRGPDGKTVLIALSMHGVIDDSGEPAFLLSDSDPLDSTTWLPVKTLLEQFKSHTASHEMNKVLLLDCNRLMDDWSIGLLHNSFADGLQKVFDDVAVPNLYAISSSNFDQRSWGSPELGASFFGYYLARALRGDADQAPRDNKITIDELSAYLGKTMTNAVNIQRGAMQKPLLIKPTDGDGDIALIYSDNVRSWFGFGGGKENAVFEERREALGARIDTLSGNWDAIATAEANHEKLINDYDSIAHDPSGLAHYRQLLHRMYQLWLSGEEHKKDLPEVAEELASIYGEITKSRQPKTATGYSIPMEMLLGNLPDRDTQKQILEFVRKNPEKALPEEWKPYQSKIGLFALESELEGLSRKKQLNDKDIASLLATVDESWSRKDDVTELLELRFLQRDVDWLHPQNDAVTQGVAGVVRSRRLAEEVACTSDVRAHHWVKPKMQDLDMARREGYDNTVVALGLTLDDTLKGLNELSDASMTMGSLVELKKFRDEVQALYRLRDEVWASAIPIGQWISHQLLFGKSNRAGQDFEKLAVRLRAAVTANRSIGSILDSQIKGSQDTLAQLRKTGKDLRENFDGMVLAIEKQAKYLIEDADKDGITAAEIEAILPMPLLTMDRREQLRGKYLEILTLLGEQRHAEVSEVGESRPADLATLTDKGGHPVLLVLARNHFDLMSEAERRLDSTVVSERPENPDRDWYLRELAAQGTEVRARLSALPEIFNSLIDKTKKRLEQTSTDGVLARMPMAQADRAQRAAIQLRRDVELVDLRRDPSFQLSLLDRHFLLTWHAKRAHDDFMGRHPATPNAPYFFDTVMTSYRRSAISLLQGHGLRRQANGKDDDLLTMLRTARKSAATLKVVLPRSYPVVNGLPVIKPRVFGRGIPQGESAVYMRMVPDTPLTSIFNNMKLRRLGLSTLGNQAGETTLNLMLDQNELGDVTGTFTKKSMQLVYVFRGHRKPADFELRPPTAIVTTTYRPTPRKKPRLRVEGEDTGGYLVIILDGSNSMNLPLDGKPGNRMEEAKKVIRQVLGHLASDNKHFVGLRAYGSRFAHGDADYRTVRVNKNNPELAALAGPRNNANDPDRDTYLVVKPQKLKDAQGNSVGLQQISEGLDKITPHGQTPLFHSILECLNNDFSDIPADASVQVLVVTDGQNKVARPAVRNEQNEIRSDVIERVKRLKTKFKRFSISTLGISVAPVDGVDGVNKLMTDVSSPYLNVASGETNTGKKWTMRDAINYLLQTRYVVVSRGEEILDKRPIGEIFELDLPRLGTPDRLKVTVQDYGKSDKASNTIQVEGNEFIKMLFNEKGSRLTFAPYVPRQSDTAQSVGEVNDTVHAGKRIRLRPLNAFYVQNEGSSLTFAVSLEYRQRNQYLVRPKRVWATVVPMEDRENQVPDQEPFEFGDVSFESDTTSPVLLFKADDTDWPEGAEWASVKLWFRNEDVKPEVTLKVEAASKNSEGIRLKSGSIFKVTKTLRGGSWEVQVTESYDERQGNRETYRVKLLPNLADVSHQRMVGTGSTIHLFRFPSAITDVNDVQIGITPKSRIIDGVELPNRTLTFRVLKR